MILEWISARRSISFSYSWRPRPPDGRSLALIPRIHCSPARKFKSAEAPGSSFSSSSKPFAARADYLVTGNQRHFPKFWKKTKVITSREFISIVAPHLLP